MDIRKLVNQGQARPDVSDAREWSTHQTLPPFSAMFPDPNYAAATGYHYPLPPQGEGGYSAAYPQYTAYHQPQAQQQQQQPQQVFLSQQFSTPSKFAPAPASASRGPATSAERRSLGTPSSSSTEDDEDDDMSDSAASSGSGGSNTPLPPYHAQAPQHHQQVFIDTSSTTSPQSSSPSSPSAEGVDYVCEDCGVSYSRAPDLRRHKASVHGDRASGEKVAATFPCEVCGQVLLSSHGYQGHMRRHYDERPFVCEAPFCGKAFHDSATLARHRRTHSTEHKFECDFCGRRFKRKDNLNTHRKKHQVGGESINPNLLRKPVTRVSSSSATQSENGGSSASGSPGSTPQIPSYGELPLASPPYQALPTQQPQPPVPHYTSIDQHAAHHQQQPPHFHLHQSQYPPQMYQAPPYYQQFQQPAPQPQQVQGIYGRPTGFPMGAVKAEEMNDMEYRRMRMAHLPPAAR
ncbi:hypothetical protein FRC04_002120 [Tulasnella sp. 424]|nr:hypothetical protein FRC04_002120 [Tulasnella sp. 424]KAG8963849.1 hypothetical protein FRC05_004390 [Tulasnella sp. 425]